MLLQLLNILHFLQLGCVDTPGWDNQYGCDCGCYEDKFCVDGAAKPGKENKLGSNFKHPEDNCCSCGKGRSKSKFNIRNRYNMWLKVTKR